MDFQYLEDVTGIPPITFLSTFLVFLLAILYYQLKNKDLPPGPSGVPILGYWPFLKDEVLHIQLTELSEKYGDVYSFTCAGILFIHLGSIKSLKEAYVSQSDCFTKRFDEFSIFTETFKDGIATLTGEEWKALRKFFIKSFREYGLTSVKDYMAGPIYDSVSASIKLLRETNGTAINIIPILNTSSSDILRRMLFNDDEITDDELKGILESYQNVLPMFTGKKLLLMGNLASRMPFNDDKIIDEELKGILEIYKAILPMFIGKKVLLMGAGVWIMPDYQRKGFRPWGGVLSMGVFLREPNPYSSLAKYFIFPRIDGFKFSLENHQKMLEYLRTVVRRHEKSYNEDDIRDIVDSYIKERNERQKKGDPTAEYFSENALVSSLVQIIGDGVLSIAVYTAYFIHALLEYPEEQEKIYEELQNVIGPDRPISLEDRNKLTYTNAFIQEVTRTTDFFTIFPDLVCTSETTLYGYRIPKGAVTVINFWSAHHDPKVFDEPNEFKPSRYISDSEKPKAEAPISFGVGKRSCAGESFTMMQVFLFLTTIIQNFRLERPEGNEKKYFYDGVMEVCAYPRKQITA